MLISILIASLSFAPSVWAQSSSTCGPIRFTSHYGPLFVEENGNLTVPYDNSSALPGAQSGSSFYIESDSSMSVLSANGTKFYCHPFIWMQCNYTSAMNEYGGHNFTIGSDGHLYVSDNSDFYLASEFSGTIDRPIPSHLYPYFEGTAAFTSFKGLNWGWSNTQLKANTCYAGHSENGQTAPTPTASYGSSINVAVATARPVAMGLGAAMLGLAAVF